MENTGTIYRYGKILLMCVLWQLAMMPVYAQMKTVTGRVMQTQFGDARPKPFEEEVRIFAFNMKRDFKKALEAAGKPGSFIVDYDNETTTDEEGYYTIQVSPHGYLLVITPNMSHTSAEVKERMVVDFFVSGDLQLATVEILGKARVAVVDSMDVIDTGATIECSSVLTLPAGIGKANSRCVFQPIVIDCETGDTVEYLTPKVYDGTEYSKTQLQRMAFNMKNDILYPYIQEEKLTGEELKIRWNGSIKKRNRKHSYTCMGAVRVADYNQVFHSDDKQISSCLARKPFQFMEYKMTLPELDKYSYKEVPRGELRDGAEMISLNFLLGTAELDPDPKNEMELNRLNEKLQQIDRSGEFQIRRIAITGYASPEGSLEFNQQLSQKRADTVKSILMQQYNISADRITAEGKGIGDFFPQQPDWNRLSICIIDGAE
jgi:outer membrane protein OmpA-like peptidoglycan-associated protein